jgi:hypothetical protein
MRGFSFSWKRALGISSAKARLSREIGIPLTSSGRQRKIGRMASGWFSALLVESSYQALRSSGKRSRRTRQPDDTEVETPPRRPSVAGTAATCLGAPVAGAIAGGIFESWPTFWVVTALMAALVIADHRNRAARYRSQATQRDLPSATAETPALSSRDGATISEMLRQLEAERRPVDRHFLMLGIVESSYRDRLRDPEMRDLCERVGLQHVAEFPAFAPALREEFGMLPRVPTFQLLATVLSERGEFTRAIDICETALSLGLHDNTVSGFEGRIDRIRKKQAAARA